MLSKEERIRLGKMIANNQQQNGVFLGGPEVAGLFYALDEALKTIDSVESSLRAAEAENAKMRGALDTYAQFAANGEVAFVSGFLARAALTGKDEK